MEKEKENKNKDLFEDEILNNISESSESNDHLNSQDIKKIKIEDQKEAQISVPK